MAFSAPEPGDAPTAAIEPTNGTTDGSDTGQPDDGLPNGI